MVFDTATASRRLFARAQAALPGGNTRHTVHFDPHPLYAASGRGAMVTDADGRAYLDFIGNYSSQIHGHCHPAIVEAVRDQAGRLMAVGLPTETEILLAEELARRLPCVEKIRFCNSGTEAVMFALRAARAATGRPKIAKVEGAYHGAYDQAEASMDPMPGNWGEGDPVPVGHAAATPASLLADVVVIPFNDVERTERILRAHGPALAAVLFDPCVSRMGFLEITPAYLDLLHRLRDELGYRLIIDEVFSFRIGYHGAQGAYGVRADYTTLGKIIGGGLPIGAIGGTAEAMAVFDHRGGHARVPHGGTFNANPLAMAAGLAALRLLTPEAIRHINALGERFRLGVNALFGRLGIAGRAIGTASMAGLLFSDRTYSEYRGFLPAMMETLPHLQPLHSAMLGQGVLFIPYGGFIMSTPMTEADIDMTLEKLELCLGTGRRAAA